MLQGIPSLHTVYLAISNSLMPWKCPVHMHMTLRNKLDAMLTGCALHLPDNQQYFDAAVHSFDALCHARGREVSGRILHSHLVVT